MRASIPLLSGVMIGILAGCSNPPAEDEAGRFAQFEAELELAIFPESTGLDNAVVSDLEILRPTPDPGSASARRAPSPAATSIAEPSVAIVTVDQPTYSPPELPAPAAVQPVVLAGDSRDRQPSVGSVRPRGRPGIIIRGGVDERDPCVIHRPGSSGGVLGDIGVLINDPTPRDIGGVANRGPSRGAGMAPRGGVFIGGIR